MVGTVYELGKGGFLVLVAEIINKELVER